MALQVISLSAENVKKLKAVRIIPKGAVVDIGGKNEAGKSTVLDLIVFGMGGKGFIDKEPIRRGQKKGWVSIDLGEENNLKYRVTRRFTAKNKGGYVEVTAADGAVYKSPQALLDSFISDLTFSPLDFMKSKDQAGMILKVSQVPFIADELAKLAGLSSTNFITAGTPFDAISTVTKGIYGQRRDAGVKVTECRSVVKGILIPEGKEDTQPVKVAELFTERQSMEQTRAANDAERLKVAGLDGVVDRKRQIVKDDKERLDKLRATVAAMEKQVANSGANLQDTIDHRAAKQAEIAALIDPDFTEIDQKLNDADLTNTIAADVVRKRDAEAALVVATEAHQKLDDKLTSVKEYREDLLQKTVFPVEGLSFDEDGDVLFEGIPLSQRGTSKQIKIGLDVLAALNPTLRVVLVKDGNDLDSDNDKVIRKWAIAKKFQIWIEKVQNEPGKVAFFIEDGEVKA